MLLFKDIVDMDTINRFIEKEAIADKFIPDGDYFGCIDEDNLIGLCKIKIKSNALLLIYIHFNEEYNLLKLELALLKCLLFRLADLDYKEIVSLQKNEKLDNIGFKEMDGKYSLDLKEFSASDCSCGAFIDER